MLLLAALLPLLYPELDGARDDVFPKLELDAAKYADDDDDDDRLPPAELDECEALK